MGCSLSLPARLRRSHLEAVERNAILNEFRAISSEMSVEPMVRRTIEGILKVLPVERASVFLVDRAGGVLRTFNVLDGNSVHVTIPISSGLAGAVARTATTAVVADAQTDERFNRDIDKQTGFTTRNVLTVPVVLKQAEDEMELDENGEPRPPTVVAVLQALNHKKAFTPNDSAVLELLSSLLSGVLARSALVDAAVRERNRAAALLQVAREVFTESVSCRAKAARCIEAIKRGLDCERASMLLVDEVNAQQLVVSLDDDAAGLRIPLDVGVSGAVVTTGEAVLISDAYSDERFDSETDKFTGFTTRNLLAVPVFRRGSEPPQVMADIEGLTRTRPHALLMHSPLPLKSLCTLLTDRCVTDCGLCMHGLWCCMRGRSLWCYAGDGGHRGPQLDHRLRLVRRAAAHVDGLAGGGPAAARADPGHGRVERRARPRVGRRGV